MIPDLHMHTTASDGVLSPRALVDFAAERGVNLMAVTDHDTFDGVDSLRGTETTIPVLTGVELSMKDMKGLHLLGYGFTDATELRRTVQELAEKRITRAARIVEKLCAMGMPLDYEAIRNGCNGTVGRLHVARAMVEAGYVRNTEAAFDKFIGEVNFTEYKPKYNCLCDRKYIEKVLVSLGKNELYDIIEKEKNITVDCQFCNKKYVFNTDDVDGFFK